MTDFLCFADLKWERDPVTGTWTVTDVPVFSVGKWNGADYDEKWCAELVENTNAHHALIRPRLGPGHLPKGLSDEERWAARSQQPRWGLIGKLKMLGQKVYAETIAKIPDALKQKIDAGEWGPMSIEAKKVPGIGWVLDFIALLGAAAPAVAGAGVDAFTEDDRLVVVFTEEPEKGVEKPHPSTDGASASKSFPPTEAEEDKLSDETKVREEALAAQEKALAEEKARLEGIAEANRVYAEKQKRGKLTFAADRLVDAEKIKPAQKQSFVEIGMNLDDEKVIAGEKTTRLDQYIEMNEAQEPTPMKTEPKGESKKPEDTRTFDEQALAFAEDFEREKRGTFHEGLAAFEKGHKDEYAEHRQQFTGAPPADVAAAAVTMKGGK